VRGDLQHAVARRVRVAMAEDGAPDVVLGDDVEDAWLLLRLGVRRHWRFPSLEVSCAGELHVRGGIVPLPQLVPVAERLVDYQLSVVAERDLHPLQRPGRGAFEIDAVLGVARAVARTLELVLRSQPARRAAQ